MEGELPAGFLRPSPASGRDRTLLCQFFTPEKVARFMGRLCAASASDGREEVFVVDPGAGEGILGAAACLALARPPVKRIKCVLFELDEKLAGHLAESMKDLEGVLAARGVELKHRVIVADFAALMIEGRVFHEMKADVIICNPPYLKIPRKSAVAEMARGAGVEGSTNMYTLFMALGPDLLRPGGSMVFLTPRSFASGKYFERFRGQFFGRMTPDYIHLFESR